MLGGSGSLGGISGLLGLLQGGNGSPVVSPGGSGLGSAMGGNMGGALGSAPAGLFSGLMPGGGMTSPLGGGMSGAAAGASPVNAPAGFSFGQMNPQMAQMAMSMMQQGNRQPMQVAQVHPAAFGNQPVRNASIGPSMPYTQFSMNNMPMGG